MEEGGAASSFLAEEAMSGEAEQRQVREEESGRHRPGLDTLEHLPASSGSSERGVGPR